MVPRDHATPCGCIALGHYGLDQKESRCAGVRSITGTAGELARRPAGGGSIKHASDRVHRLGNTSDATMHRAVVLPGRPGLLDHAAASSIGISGLPALHEIGRAHV